MQKLICQQCQGALKWDGQSEIVRCEYCGTRYRMHPRQNAGSGVRKGLGEVSAVQTTRGRYAGRALVKSFIPLDWSVETNAPEQESNLRCPLTIQTVFSSPTEDACITFTGTRGYDHLEPTPQNAPMQGRMILPDRVLGLCYRDAGAVCDGVIAANPAISDARLLQAQETPDPWAREQLVKWTGEYQKGGLLNPGGTWAKKIFTVRDAGGALWYKQLEAMVSYGYLPVSPGEQMAYQMLMQSRERSMGLSAMLAARGRIGGLLAGMATPQVQAPQPKLRWAVNYVIETSAREERFREALDYHDRIRGSMEILPLFEQEKNRIFEALMLQAQRESAAINDAMSQMNRDQMASWDRKQQIVQGASDYGSNVMHQMFDSNAATMQRVNNLRSESIRGVNTYYTREPGFGVPPVVEASTQWDHVYQNTQAPDWFAASTGEAPLDFGVDYEELKKTNGDY